MEKKIRIIHIDVPIELHEYLKKLKGGRSWIQWLKEIQQDFKRLAEENKLLRDKIDLLEQLRIPTVVDITPLSGDTSQGGWINSQRRTPD